jgi:hypothetical protein
MFEVGDRVEVIATGEAGTVEEVLPAGVRVRLDGPAKQVSLNDPISRRARFTLDRLKKLSH